MIKKVENFCLNRALFKAHDKLVVACSGGPDSIALVDILRRIQDKYDLKLYIAHAEHGIRQKSSLEDAEYVRAYCQKYSLPFYMEHLQVPNFARKNKLSMETAARILRYRFLRKVKKQTNSVKIATAHHLNDQAETFLQHLIRGAGSEGLSGMRPVSDDIIRPFLCLYRCEVENYCQEHNLNPRLDETNFSLDYERNKIRLELLPRLEKYNINIVRSICNSAEIISQENEYINLCAEKSYSKNCIEEENRVNLKADAVKKEHIAVRTALYRLIIKKIQGNLENIGFKHIDKIDKFLYNGHTGLVLQLPHNLRIEQNYGKLIFQKGSKNTKQIKDYKLKMEMNASIILHDGQVIEMKKIDRPFKITGNEQCFIDGDKLTGIIYVRNRTAGDRIKPKGLNGTKKVKDIFIDKKIPADLRDTVPLVCDERGIIWIAGIQQDDYYTINENSKNIIHLSLKKL